MVTNTTSYDIESYITKYSNSIKPDLLQNKQICKILATDETSLKMAAESIKNGNLVSFPTETVYGLGADATNEQAIRKIYQAKGRPLTDPVIAHISSVEMLKNMVDYKEADTELLEFLGENIWPGPLTIIVKANLDYIP